MPARAERESTFHPNIRRDYLETSFQRAREDGQITAGDEEVIRRYISEREATRGISEGRALKIGYALIQWRRFIPAEYTGLTYGDVIKGLELLKKGKSIRGRAFKQNTLHDHVRILKTFLPWLIDEYRLIIPEKKIREIKVPAVDRETTHPEEILTEEEILALLKACLTDRDRALIGTLYESGCRVGELARLTWQDVVFDEHGVRLYITDKKTGKRRYSRLTMSAPYLATLKDAYPRNRAREIPGSASVFISGGDPVEYQQVTALLRRLVKRTGIKKRIHLHLFRKSRITEMVREGYQESVIKESCWGNAGTSMFRTYVRLSEKAIDEEFLRRQGRLIEKEERQAILATRRCANCHQENPPTALWCNRCRSPLTEDASERKFSIEKYLETNPAYAEIVKFLPDLVRKEVQKRLSESVR